MKQEERLAQAIKAYIKDLKNEVVVCVADRVAGFVDGMNKQRNSVWHNAGEEPEMYKPFIIINSNGVMTASYEVMNSTGQGLSYEKIKELDKVVKWAYISDLSPDVEPNKELKQ